jgi:hypothetical protein
LAQVAEHLPSKHKALNSNPNANNKKQGNTHCEVPSSLRVLPLEVVLLGLLTWFLKGASLGPPSLSVWMWSLLPTCATSIRPSPEVKYMGCPTLDFQSSKLWIKWTCFLYKEACLRYFIIVTKKGLIQGASKGLAERTLISNYQVKISQTII